MDIGERGKPIAKPLPCWRYIVAVVLYLLALVATLLAAYVVLSVLGQLLHLFGVGESPDQNWEWSLWEHLLRTAVGLVVFVVAVVCYGLGRLAWDPSEPDGRAGMQANS